MKNIGVVFGTFATMHIGHIDLIHKAKKELGYVFVVVSGYYPTKTRESDRGYKIGLNLERRFQYIRELFANDSLVKVVELDETHIPEYPHGWTEWIDKCKRLINFDDKLNYTFYVSEKEYKDELEKRGFNTKLFERQYGISATKIRNNPIKYWNYIAHTFKRHFTKKVWVGGSASNGKTTLCNDLGRMFDAPVSLEFAREYQTKYGIVDEDLKPNDYYWFLMGQFQQTADLIDGRSNKGLVIADTDAVITKAYFDYYNEKEKFSEIETEAFQKLFDAIVLKEKWDLMFFVEPNGKYVDDNFRDMSMAKN